MFGPPAGSFDVDWVASAAQAADPELGHDRAVALAGAAWSSLRGGTPPADLASALAAVLPGEGAGVVAAVSVEYCSLYGVDPDPFDLQRFVRAQEATYDGALAELRAGRKRGHWVWFVLPQLVGLGHSVDATRYGLRGLAEARAYAAHQVLGPRLRECAEALLALPDDDPAHVLGAVDARKLQSCATLFALAVPEEPSFRALLDRWYGGRQDPGTLERLPRTRSAPPS